MAEPRVPVLITGAQGFVGGHVRAALAASVPGAELVMPECDVADPAAVDAAIAAARPASVIHLAGIAAAAVCAADPARAWQVNLHGTLHVAAAIARHVPGAQLVFASSADVYGASFGEAPLDEGAVLAPMSLYGATKAAADLALGAMPGEAVRVVRLRPFNHVGAGQSADFALASFARQIARIGAGRQAPVIEVGRLDTRRDFLDVRDVAAAYAAAVLRRDALPDGAIVNLASGVARRIGDVLAEMLRLAGVDATIREGASRARPGDIATACGDARRAAALLGWAPRFAWPDTLGSVIADWRARVAAGAP